MRHPAVGAGLLVQLMFLVLAIWPGCATASPASGPHETLDNRYTTTEPNAVAGFDFTGSYHAAGDPAGNPPYMRRMVFYLPPGLRYDTSVPKRCSASDLELATFGTAACPPGSRLGGGTSTTSFMGSTSTTERRLSQQHRRADHPGAVPGLSTVSRGRISPDGSVDWASPTCFPSVQPAGCPVDDVLQLESSISVAPYTKTSHGVVRSYLTTPPTCPAAGHWETPIRLWFADGSIDNVTTEQPCTSGP